LAVGAAEEPVMVDPGAAVSEHRLLKLDIGVDHSAGQHHATGSELSWWAHAGTGMNHHTKGST